MKRYALGIEYDGSGFNGWQAQANDPSVQVCVENAISKIANHPLRLACAGRTDTGVHAVCQVAHFDSQVIRTERQWVLGINSHLPDTVCVRWVQQVDEEFHARFSAIERHYQYRILNRWVRPALRVGLVSWCRRPLDIEIMNTAVGALLGEHDFSAFRSAGCKANHAVREVTKVSVQRKEDEIILNIAANSFLYHMVRNIAGSLIKIGHGEKPVEWMGKLLAEGDRKQAGMTAPADGLYFMSVRYPDAFRIPGDLAAFPQVR